MSRARVLAYVAVGLWIFAGCKQGSTGLHAHVHLGTLSYDEIRFAIFEISQSDASSSPNVLVDPSGAGRKMNLSGGPEQDVVILLPDDVDGQQIVCDVAVLKGGAPVGSGDGIIKAEAHQIRDVDVYIMGAPNNDASAGGQGGSTAAGGSSGAGGSGGSGGSVGTGGASGTGGATGAGGASGTGGSDGVGGRAGSGGTSVDAGVDAPAEGGSSGSGGMRGTGGSGAGGTGAGGASGVGGASGTGGKAGTGALGSVCTSGGECASTYCVDGVCCDGPCNTACMTCNFNKGTAGSCRQAMNKAVDPHHICVDTGIGNCGTDGTCDNTGACATKFGMACSNPPCAAENARAASGICGQGDCLPVGSILCPPATPGCVGNNVCQ